MNVTIAPSFVPNPPGRGTVGLLSECLLAYLLCLWTVVHTAVVPHHKLIKLNSKVFWCCLILFVPDVALFAVMCEYFTAREVCQRVKKGIIDHQDGELALPTGSPGDEIPADLPTLATSSQSPPTEMQSPPTSPRSPPTGDPTGTQSPPTVEDPTEIQSPPDRGSSGTQSPPTGDPLRHSLLLQQRIQQGCSLLQQRRDINLPALSVRKSLVRDLDGVLLMDIWCKWEL